MAIKNKPCKLHGEGCKSFAWKEGFCWKHHPDHVANKAAARAEKQAIRDIHKADAAKVIAHVEKAALVQVKEIVTEEGGCVQQETPEVQEITNIDYLAFMRQKFDEKFEEWAGELNKSRTPYERAQRYLDQCDAIIGLGY